MAKKRAFIIHGWGGDPSEGWLAWLKNQLEAQGFIVSVPAMPDTDHPKIEAWVETLRNLVGSVDEQTYFIGHSIGCQAILRYLATLPENQKAGGAVLVAAWLHLTDETWDEDYTREIAESWLQTPIDFDKIRNTTLEMVAIQSDNDPYVPFADAEEFNKFLGAKIIIEHNAGHISGEDGIISLPNALTALLSMAGEGN